MIYEGNVFRPPSEAYSLIVQVTIGCSHNKCTFCSMYKDKKFRMRKLEDIKKDLDDMSIYKDQVRRIFFADGDALMMNTESLVEIMRYSYEVFPYLERIGIYASPKSILVKTVDELKILRNEGLKIAYLGVESGFDKVLQNVKKGATSDEIVRCSLMLKEAKITISIMLILGLGGENLREEHIKGSIDVINRINPDYLSFLTLIIEEGTKLYDQVKSGEFKPTSPIDDIREIKEIITGTNLDNCITRSNHASNYVSVKGTLGEDKEKIIRNLNDFLSDSDMVSRVIGYKDMTRRL